MRIIESAMYGLSHTCALVSATNLEKCPPNAISKDLRSRWNKGSLTATRTLRKRVGRIIPPNAELGQEIKRQDSAMHLPPRFAPSEH
jgi:hypothetical protein